ncbi:MAG: DUF2848 domain-containing protein [Beijerinckiaceae bacterium]
MLVMNRVTRTGRDTIHVPIHATVIAGWAARDEAAVRHHIEELAALGVPPPSSFPIFYRVSSSTLTQTESLCVLGPDSSGEIEPVIVALADGLWVGVGSDHTDRKAETHGIALSKQLCGKVVGHDFWPLAEVAGHWDQLQMRAYATIDGQRVAYQDGTLATLRTPADLIARWLPAGHSLQPGTLIFGGTLSAIGGIRPAGRFEMEIHDPVLNRTIRHGYDIVPLAVVS